MRTWIKRSLRVSLVLFLVLALGGCIALSTMDKWLFVVLDPGPFDPSQTPAAPDYREPSAWAALPTTQDDADVSLAALPALDQKSAPADVFFVHPTTWIGSQWNVPIDDPEVIQATARGATLIQASAFNACCAVYAPRYRQANGKTFVAPNEDSDKALDVAYQDVLAAFRIFLTEHNKGRPFLLASHSQGTFLAERLLKEEILGKEPQNRLVVAYLIGGPITEEALEGKIKVCSFATETRCVVGWNARGPNWRGNGFEFVSRDDPNATNRVAGRLCVNPLSWKKDGAKVPASSHQGAIFFDTEEPSLLPSFASADCQSGVLVTEVAEMPDRDFMSEILLWVMGPENYHPIEYQIFYANLRSNAKERLSSFLQAR